MTVTVKDLIGPLETLAPKSLAMPKDPIGLQFSTLDKPVKKVLITLDIRPSVVKEAIEKNIDLIIAHHPPVYKPVQFFDLSNPQTKMYADLMKHDISVYAAHTNLDVAEGGMNDWLGEALGLVDLEVMSNTMSIPSYKIIVFVPKESSEQVRLAMTNAGAGQFDEQYHECSFSSIGIGRFTPKKGAHPTIGEINLHQEVEEERIEMLCLESHLNSVIEVLKVVHPYESPAYDILRLENTSHSMGLGRVGNLSEPVSFDDFLDLVAKTFHVKGLRYVLPTHHEISEVKRVAICGGDAGSFYMDALKKHADVYITGDVYYHTAHDMQECPMAIIDPGHHIESICIEKLTSLYEEWKREQQWDVEIYASKIHTDPFQFYVPE